MYIEDIKEDSSWLMKGDCLERMKEIPDGSVDLILTDPPYGTTACKWDSVIPLEPMWEQLKRIIKPNGAIVLFGSQPFTLCFWAKDGDGNGSFANANPFVLSKGAYFLFRNEPPFDNWIFVPVSFSSYTYNWIHIAIVADGSRIKGYLNGVQQFSIPHPNWPSENSLLEFGPVGFGVYNSGTLDEVLLYSEALWTSNFTPPTAPFTY